MHQRIAFCYHGYLKRKDVVLIFRQSPKPAVKKPLSSSMHHDIIFPLMIDFFQFLTLSNMSYVQGDIIFPLIK